jgi:hypothetical protein
MTSEITYEIARFLREDLVILVSDERGEELFECFRRPEFKGSPCHISGLPLESEIGWISAGIPDGRVIAEATLKSLPKA